ncbi:MAG: biotin transporter BioY [Clostridia bacterium]|nr:biotin transporter BioY [Clostridia bacterium]
MKKRIKAASLVRVALGSALISVTSWISLPSPLPYTLQTFGVFFTLCLLGGGQGGLSVLVYVLMGALGFPVFSGFRGGIAVLLGATGGYITGFILSALIFRFITQLGKDRLCPRIIACICGIAVCWISGSLWYALTVTGSIVTGFISALGVCVVPFIVPDIIKITAAIVLAEAVGRRIGRRVIR